MSPYDFPFMPDQGQIERDRDIVRLARELCRCAGDDPDAQVIPGVYAIRTTAQGHKIVDDILRVAQPCWMTYQRQAAQLIEAGWQRRAEPEVKAS